MNDPYIHQMVAGFESEMKKIAVGVAAVDDAAKAGKGIMGLLGRKEVILPVAGAAAYKLLSDAESDRRMGRQIRRQNPGM